MAEVRLLLDLLLVVCRLPGSIPAVTGEPEHGVGSVSLRLAALCKAACSPGWFGSAGCFVASTGSCD